MKTEISYEWCIETIDENGDIINSDFSDILSFFSKEELKEKNKRLVLVRNEENENKGLIVRFWAYVKAGVLPNFFEDSSCEEVKIKVPAKFHKELSTYAPAVLWQSVCAYWTRNNECAKDYECNCAMIEKYNTYL